MRPQDLIEFEAPDQWVYLVFDDQGNASVVTQDEWEALFRPAPDEEA